MNVNEDSTSLPAILGGVPLRTQGLPDWPVSDETVVQVLAELGRTGDWGRYHAAHCSRLIEQLQSEHQVPHVHLTSSGTAAVELALRGLQIGQDAEVIMSVYDFKSNFSNIAMLGAKPVLVPLDLMSGQIDLDHLEAAISLATEAILVSHLHGAAVDMPRLMEIAERHSLPVIEDVSQMNLATIAGRPAGTWGDVGILSFGGSKLLTAGRGGAVITSRDDIINRVRRYTLRGNDAYPLSEMQAAVLLPQIARLPERRQQRESIAAGIRAVSLSQSGLRPFQNLVPDCELDYFKLGFWYDPQSFSGLTREAFCAAMRAEGIPFAPGFRGLHLVHARNRFRASGDLSTGDLADQSIVVLHHPYLMEGDSAIAIFQQALDRITRHSTKINTIPPDRFRSESI
ncbi:DegT/DnrJ/EryC1/StrS family aminotransferase [Planctomicrobium sp. SH527]|uniref:DegT/DnrJ/EryC1/StrS family aminotransferase n=1 Tax=Planctomicrobium sp. SH527 TaxID=3448123 RepID=UPI003F5BD6B9